MSTSGDTTPLEADFAALRKLRDDDASGAIKENVGDDEDPRKWRDGNAVTAKDDRVTRKVQRHVQQFVPLRHSLNSKPSAPDAQVSPEAHYYMRALHAQFPSPPPPGRRVKKKTQSFDK